VGIIFAFCIIYKDFIVIQQEKKILNCVLKVAQHENLFLTNSH